MLKELPHRTFLEWQEFDRLEPIGGQRGDWQVASVCSLLANLAAARSGSTHRFTTRDFLLEWRDASELEKIEAEVKQAVAPVEPTTPWQTMKFYARMYAAQANADENKKQKRKR
jgi:hypothetical protein